MNERRKQDVQRARALLASMEQDPYKAPEQVEEARQHLCRVEAAARECSCDDPDQPFCSVHVICGAMREDGAGAWDTCILPHGHAGEHWAERQNGGKS